MRAGPSRERALSREPGEGSVVTRAPHNPSAPVTRGRTWGAKGHASRVCSDRAGFDGARESDSWTDMEF